jgi:hypothetical protein
MQSAPAGNEAQSMAAGRTPKSRMSCAFTASQVARQSNGAPPSVPIGSVRVLVRPHPASGASASPRRFR